MSEPRPPSPPARPPAAERQAQAGLGGSWQRLHPLSPFVRAGRGVIGIVVLLLIPTSGRRGGGVSADLPHIAVLVVFFVLGFISWLVTRWRVQDGVLRVESGLLRRTSERFPLSRIQAIDTVRPGLARVFGLSELRIRLASGSGRAGRLAYLTSAEAETLRARLLELSRGSVVGATAAAGGASDAGAASDAGVAGAAVAAGPPERPPAPEQTLVTVPPTRLLASLLLTGRGLVLELAIVALAVLAILAPSVASAAFGTELVVIVGLGIGLFRSFNGDYRLTVTDSDDGLRLRSGLVETSAETIPRGRIQAIRMVEPLAWRLCGWCRLEVDVASQKSKGRQDRNQAKAGRALLPVGSAEQAASMLASVFPGLPDARLAPPSRARWKSPLRFHHLSWGSNERYAVTTSGRIRRVTDWVPLAKVQSIRLREGPLQRPLELSSIHLDTAGRRVYAVARDRDRAEAARLMRELPERCREAR